jgi:hypothetical protein
MGSFAQAYREIVNKPLNYARIMLYFLVMAVLSVLAPFGVVGLFSLLTSYSNFGSMVISLAGIAIYAVVFLLLFDGSYGALLKAIDTGKDNRDMGFDEMVSYALGNCFKLSLIKAVELALIALFAAIVFITLYLLKIDLSNQLYLGLGIVVLGIPALLVQYLFSLAMVSYTKSRGAARSISKSFRIAILRAVNYIPVYVMACIIMATLLIPLINIVTFFILYPMALLALIKEYEKLLL